jgi:acetyl/propionyl-CoA carboxylase alpha subunit
LTRVAITGRAPLRVRIAGTDHVVVEHVAPAGEVALDLDGVRVTGHRYDAGDRVFVRIAGRTFIVPRAARTQAARDREELRADMPGTVVRLHVSAGQRVAAGDPLVTIESMKLQVVIAADRDATVATLPIAEHGTFDRGAVLVTLAEAS